MPRIHPSLACSILMTGSCLSAQAISGRVLDAGGRPVPGAWVCIYDQNSTWTGPVAPTLSDRSGSFHLKGSARSGLCVSAWAPGHAPCLTPLPEGGKPLTLTLTSAKGRLMGHVAGPHGPLREGWVMVTPDTLELEPLTHSETAGVIPVRNGRFEMPLPERGYILQFQAPGCAPDMQAFEVKGRTELRQALKGLPRLASPAVTESLRRVAVPLRGCDPTLGLEDLAPLAGMVGEARIVGLGEATHGTCEHFQMKHRILRFLVERIGFNVFAIEASLPDTLAIDAYVRTGEGDPEALIHAMGFWTWDTEEVLALVKWIRQWNADPAHTRKVRFLGIDMQDRKRLVPMLKARLADRLPDAAARLEQEIAGLSDAWDMDQSVSRDTRRAKARVADDLLKAAEEARMDPLTLQLARVLAQNLAMVAAETATASFNLRDQAMAANMTWALGEGGTNARAALWAHNGHVSCAPFGGYKSLGQNLRRIYGSAYRPIGFTFDHGGFQAKASGDEGLRPFTVAPAPDASFAHALASLKTGVALVDLRNLPDAGGLRAWAVEQRPDWNIGAMYDSGFAADFQPFLPLAGAFDLLVHVDATTRARPLKRALWMADLPVTRVHAAPTSLALAETGTAWTFHGPFHVYEDRTIRSTTPEGRGIGSLYQAVDATPYRGKSVRMTLAMSGSASGRAGIEKGARAWIRIDGRELLDLKAVGCNLKATDGTKVLTVDVHVPQEAMTIVFGAALIQDGWLRIEQVAFAPTE